MNTLNFDPDVCSLIGPVQCEYVTNERPDKLHCHLFTVGFDYQYIKWFQLWHRSTSLSGNPTEKKCIQFVHRILGRNYCGPRSNYSPVFDRQIVYIFFSVGLPLNDVLICHNWNHLRAGAGGPSRPVSGPGSDWRSCFNKNCRASQLKLLPEYGK